MDEKLSRNSSRVCFQPRFLFCNLKLEWLTVQRYIHGALTVEPGPTDLRRRFWLSSTSLTYYTTTGRIILSMTTVFLILFNLKVCDRVTEVFWSIDDAQLLSNRHIIGYSKQRITPTTHLTYLLCKILVERRGMRALNIRVYTISLTERVSEYIGSTCGVCLTLLDNTSQRVWMKLRLSGGSRQSAYIVGCTSFIECMLHVRYVHTYGRVIDEPDFGALSSLMTGVPISE